MKRRNNVRFLWFTTAHRGQIGCHISKIKSLSPDELILTDGRRFQLDRTYNGGSWVETIRAICR